ncbi:hypothetical protein [Streptomyces coffeae]|uniref:Secreted protein n=1 Tax=Streptomyces coffeae TaxID=621382 RepID=A0ABS1NKE5_9ACTN|nr:hypothetical protein [Streptomyces coffeae]MBL1100494.1 hypothetical protein [Streptomyces coffeae]
MAHRLPLRLRRRIVAAAAIGGVTCASVVAGAALADLSDPSGQGDVTASAAAASRISCPPVSGSLPEVPAGARAEVDRNLALLDAQLAEAGSRLAASPGTGGPDPAFVRDTVLGPLKDQRSSTIERIARSISRQGVTAPSGLGALAGCSLGSG